MKDLVIALGLLLFIEGIFCALFPSKIKNIIQKVQLISNQNLRSTGVMFAIIGFIIVWYAKN